MQNDKPRKVCKRDGSEVLFDAEKICTAILQAGQASEEFERPEAQTCTARVVKVLEHTGTTERVIGIERIQDIVEQVLISANHMKTARGYITYREQHKTLRADKRTLVDVSTSVNEYLDRADWRVNANANQGYSLGGLILNCSGKMMANYWLSHVYPPEVGRAHREGDIHIHDLDMLAGYCAGWSLRTLLHEGLNGVPGRVEATPPRHLSSAVGQIVNFLGTLQNEWAGAQAFSSFDTYMAPFVRKDGLSYEQVLQGIQELIYNLNVPSRWGCVDAETEVLTVGGFVKHDELEIGDIIYSWDNGKLVTNPVKHVVRKTFTGKLHGYLGRTYEQVVTPEHRVLALKHNGAGEFIAKSEEIFGAATPYKLPVKFTQGAITSPAQLSDAAIQLAAFIYTDGSLDYRATGTHKVSFYKSSKRFGNPEFEQCCADLDLKYSTALVTHGFSKELIIRTFYGDAARSIENIVGSRAAINPKFMSLDARASDLFLRTWAACDGSAEKFRLQYDNDTIRDQLQEIAIRAGYTTYLWKKGGTKYIKVRKAAGVYPTERTEIDYDGLVWCPSVESGTAIFRRNGSVFISGQCQTPFTNLTFDWVCPEDLREQIPVIGGEEMPFAYGDLQVEMDMINRAYIEVMSAGDAKGRIFTFPIPTYNITTDFPWESENAERLFAMTAKYGLPYFQNFLNSELTPNMVRSMCCRLQLDLRELLKRGNGLFGSAEQTGSLGVVTVSCARLGYLYAHNETMLLEALDKLLVLARNSLEIKRKVVQRHMDAGLFPYTKRYLGTLRNHFSTIGVNGINEMIRNFTDDAHDITSKWGHDFACRLLDHIRQRMVEFQEETGHMYNLEATPAEGTTYRFAREDRKRWPSILQAGGADRPYYTNSSQLPVGFTDDPFEALERQDELQRKYTGGTVLHLYMNERISSTEACKRLVRRSLETFRLPYITITPTFSVCPVHGYLSGEHEYCPKCDAELLARKQKELHTPTGELPL